MDAFDSITLRSVGDKFRCKLILRDDGRLVALKLRKNEKGEWMDPPPGQGERVIVTLQQTP
jgi:hypothetical protein